MAAGQALRRYRNVVQDLRPDDPFFITRYGQRNSRWAVHMMMANCGRAADVEGVRCSLHLAVLLFAAITIWRAR
jgi:hypothetical protein